MRFIIELEKACCSIYTLSNIDLFDDTSTYVYWELNGPRLYIYLCVRYDSRCQCICTYKDCSRRNRLEVVHATSYHINRW